jgi:hypothetical protein
MESPKRRWGVPLSRLKDENDISHILGAPAPVIHIHANNEEAIVGAMLKMQAEHWIFGHKMMVSGIINPRNVQDQVAVFGRRIPEPTEVQCINPDQDANKPLFSLDDAISENPRDVSANDDKKKHFKAVDDMSAKMKRILATKPDNGGLHFAAVDKMGRDVERILAKNPTAMLALS